MAKKTKSVFICTSCGAEHSGWMGRCAACGEWNTIEEDIMEKATSLATPGVTPPSRLLSQIQPDEHQRVQTRMDEFNLLCGGGIVPGSVLLIGGEPGIGKSTLALQLAQSFSTLYCSGEESPQQIRQRADRIGINCERITATSATILEDILHLIESEKPGFVIIDSVQTLVSRELASPAGSVSQIRNATSRLAEVARQSAIPFLLVGHITKEGSIAGPKLLEHLVDTVLYFEGDFTREYRMLRAFKNRYGSVNEIALFEMTRQGLIEISDKSRLFMNPSSSAAPGNAISAAVEGSRTVLFEVQSLVTATGFTNPRRMADGFDLNRLVLLLAVLEKHAGLGLSSFDVFINVAGGFRVHDTASDLAIACAVASSLKNTPVDHRTGFLGEISLSGEIRPVTQSSRRIQEFSRSGFTRLILSPADAAEAEKTAFSGEIVSVRGISEAIQLLL